ncbi:MAG TPA: methyltransferase [Nitrospirota bacterium]|nr:methyltransferase [Nitrospirota bacterium]
MKINQDRLISLAAGFQYSRILLTANELGIFRAISGGADTPGEIARSKKLDPEATRMLLGALVGLGLVTHRAGRFKNAPDVQRYLAADSDDGMSCIFRHMNHMYESWGALDGIVKNGRPKHRPAPKVLSDKRYNRDFICGMFEIGLPTARMLARELDFTGVMKMADIGGGPAVYPVAFAERHGDVKFVVADYPNTIAVARGYVKKYGLADRVRLVKCEFFDAPELNIGKDYDMALLSQVLHAASDKKCAELISKTYRILRPGGRVVINENALDKDGMGPPPPLIFAINMLVQNEGRTFTVDEVSAWLADAGFRKIKSRRLHERSVIIEAVK